MSEMSFDGELRSKILFLTHDVISASVAWHVFENNTLLIAFITHPSLFILHACAITFTASRKAKYYDDPKIQINVLYHYHLNKKIIKITSFHMRFQVAVYNI